MKTAITVQIDGSSLPQFFLSKLQELPNATVNLLYKRKCTWLHALVKSLSAVAVEMWCSKNISSILSNHSRNVN